MPRLQRGIEFTISTKCYWIIHGLTDFPKCKLCGKKEKYIGKNIININNGYFDYCSTKCMANSKEIKQKKKQTCINKYGKDSYFKTIDCKIKTKKTKFEKYGNDNYTNIEKSKQTRLMRYGKWESDLTSNKRKKTNIERYGSENVFSSNEIIKKIHQTCINRFGTPYPQQIQNINQKGQQTKLKKYGTIGLSFSYKYNGLLFDSMPEVAFYIWLIDRKIEFNYHPKSKFEFIFENKRHIYIPDFEINRSFYEIKGDMFFEDKDKNKKMICPWDRTKDDLYEAKHQCMIQNNVKIMTYDDYKKYIEYCEQKFNDKDWYLIYRTRNTKFFSSSKISS